MDRRARLNRERKAKKAQAAARQKAKEEKEKGFADRAAEKEAARAAKRASIEYDDDSEDGSDSSEEGSSSSEEEDSPEQFDGGERNGEEDGEGQSGELKKTASVKFPKISFHQLANPVKKKTKKQLAKEAAEKKRKRLEDERLERESLDPKTGAYRAFAMIDADGSGRVTVRELARFISGNLIDDFNCTFHISDTGMTFTTNKRNEIEVKSIEEGSPADNHPDMDCGLTILSVNGEQFGTRRGNVTKLNRFLKAIPEGSAVVFNFKEPAFACGEYSCWIDIEVEGREGVHSIQMDPRAYTLSDDFISEVNRRMHKIKELQDVKVVYLEDEQRVCFLGKDESVRVRLCGDSGPNHNMNCHALLGFGQHDTPFKDELVGLPKSMNLGLNLSVADTLDVCQKLMDLYDTNGNQLFEFDEFVALYNTYLATEKHIQKLREFCRLQYRTPEQIKADKEARREERAFLKRADALAASRPKNKAIMQAQKEKRKKMMYVDEKGNLRKYTPKQLAQEEYRKRQKELEEDNWAGLMGGIKVPNPLSVKSNKGLGVRKLVSMTAAKLLRRSAETVDANKGKNAAIDTRKAELMKAARDAERAKRKAMRSKLDRRRTDAARAARQTEHEINKLKLAEDQKLLKQMASVGMEGLLDDGKSGAQVAHQSWLGFIPLPQPASFDSSTRSPIFCGLRYGRPVSDPSVNQMMTHITRMMESPAYADHPLPSSSGAGDQGVEAGEVNEPPANKMDVHMKEVYCLNLWYYMQDPKPRWVEEERMGVTERLVREYRQKYAHKTSGAQGTEVGSIIEEEDEREEFDVESAVTGPTLSMDGALSADAWSKGAWDFVSNEKPKWMVDAMDVALIAAEEQAKAKHKRTNKISSEAVLPPKPPTQPKRRSVLPAGPKKSVSQLCAEERERIVKERSVWWTFPCPPISKGKIRQTYGSFSTRYDRAEVVHPAAFGYSFASGVDSPSFIHPSFMGYELRRAPMDQPVKRSELFFRIRKGDAVDVCPVCLVGKVGCPYCWEFPPEWDPVDFEFKGSKMPLYGGEIPDQELHTQLTTKAGIRTFRDEEMQLIEIVIKTFPTGPVLRTVVDKFATVGYLHFMHRSNTIYGTRRDQVLILPTMKGLYYLDNELKPETDLALGVYTTDVELQRYGIRKDKSVVVMLHYVLTTRAHIIEPLQHYLSHNTYMMQQPSMQVHHHVRGLASELPGDDLLQAELRVLFGRQWTNDLKQAKADDERTHIENYHQANSQKEAEDWLVFNQRREERNAEHLRRRKMGLGRRAGGAAKAKMIKSSTSDEGSSSSSEYGSDDSEERARKQKSKKKKAKKVKKEGKQRRKSEHMLMPRIATSSTTASRLGYHLGTPGLAVAQKHLQHVTQLEQQLNYMESDNDPHATKINPKAVQQMRQQIAEVKTTLSEMQMKAVNRKGHEEFTTDLFNLHNLEIKLGKLQDQVQKAFEIQLKSKLAPKFEAPPVAVIEAPKEVDSDDDDGRDGTVS